jgi:hypothetical protein
MTRNGLLAQDAGFGLTDAGVSWLTGQFGVEPAALQHRSRPIARPCLDWTERRTHLAGIAGAEICARLMRQGWLERIGSSRAVRVTGPGSAALRELFGIEEH